MALIYVYIILIFCRFMDEENSEMTDFIRKSVQGIAPDESVDVINGT